MRKDPIVTEVRKHRKKIELECDGDFSLLFAKAKEAEKKFVDELKLKPKSKSDKTKTPLK